MKPRVICHMVTSVDGRIVPNRWRPQSWKTGLYERLHERLGGQAWLVGRVTGQHFAKALSYPVDTEVVFPREPWLPTRGASAYAVVLDAHGKIAWGQSEIEGDPIVAVLTDQVSDGHLAGLRADGVSYIFAGETQVDLRRALEILRCELGVERLLLEGGGAVNGSFLSAGLVDEISLIIWPVIDGTTGAPSLFDASPADGSPPIRAMCLLSSENLDDGAIWLRYGLENA